MRAGPDDATPPDEATTSFERARPRLFGIAYRMLGSVADAEDLVQETYLRWQAADAEAVRAPEGWLVAVITRLSIDRLRRAKVERRAYTGTWLPEPVTAAVEPTGPARKAELASELSIAFLVLLEQLTPEERAAFLLREVFDCDYREIARTLEKSEAACRQMVHRARDRVRRDRPRFAVPPDAKEQLLGRFVAALAAEDREGLLAVVADHVTWTSDGGGKVPASRNVVAGADRVVRLLMGLERKQAGALDHRIERINGEPAMVTYQGTSLAAITSLQCDGSRITAFYCVLNPDKLRHVRR
jgi:RNA polymerase sigma-70 factor, ECF subfamily